MNKKLENEIELLPESPGVYLMYNVLNTIIYVGKAKNLRKPPASPLGYVTYKNEKEVLV